MLGLFPQMTDTIRSSQQEDPEGITTTGAQIQSLSPSALPRELWEQDPEHPQANKY